MANRVKHSEILRDIAKVFANGLDKNDMTKAELQTVEILVENNIMTWKNNEHGEQYAILKKG